MSRTFSHIDEHGNSRMVDVGHKDATRRVAVAQAVVRMAPETLALLRDKALPKGDAMSTAKIAGILAAKSTHQLIPLCHPLPLSYVDVDFEVDEPGSRIVIRAEARTTSQTGVEMEALTAANIAALTIYDMCKAVQKDMIIEGVKLLYKSGGKSGIYEAADE
ncbi:MAG: cyclic pyranopterin monophosphate synthase MoaC [Desulfocurvibacter africanus]